MARTKRRGWRRDFQWSDQMDNECADGTSQHNGPLQIEYGLAQEENRQEEASIDGHGNTSQPIKKKARGPTYMKDIWALTKDDERVKVSINEFGLPIGETAGKFAEFLSTVAKNASYAPINYSRWNDMPDNKKKEMIGLVKKKFELPPGMECVILESLAIKWRNWKALLKAKYFDIKEPIEVQMEVKDVRVNKDQWGQLMTYWKSEKAQELSRRNKEIRKHKILNHRTGKKSFALVATEMKCASGRSPTRVDRFKKCYSDKAGNAKNDDVARNIAKMDKITLDLPAGACDKISRDDVFAKVTGKDRNGRVE